MDAFSLAVQLTLKDMLTQKWNKVVSDVGSLKEKLKDNEKELTKLENHLSRFKWSGAIASGSFGIAKSMFNARLESSKLEANIRSLGVSSKEVDKISLSALRMSAEFGIAKEDFLKGAYDMKSAIPTLDASNIDKVTESVAKLATATKGDFSQLSKTLGMVYNQFASLSGLSDIDFAQKTADQLSYATKQFRTDGAAIEQAFNSAGATAAKMGISVGEQMAVLGTLMNSMTAGESGTAYSQFNWYLYITIRKN